MAQPLQKMISSFTRKLKIEPPQNPAILRLGIYQKKMKTLIWKDICTLMFIAELFKITKIWKWPKCVCMHAQSYSVLCNPMDCSLQGSSVHGIFQVRILEWVVMPSSRGSCQPGIELTSPMSPTLQADSLPLSHWRRSPDPHSEHMEGFILLINLC